MQRLTLISGAAPVARREVLAEGTSYDLSALAGVFLLWGGLTPGV